MILPHDLPVGNSKQFRIDSNPPPVEVVDLRLVDPRQRYLRAVAVIRVAGLVIRGVRVVQLRGRLAVQMPESRAIGGIWEPVIVIEAPALRLAIADQVLDAFRAAAPFGGLT